MVTEPRMHVTWLMLDRATQSEGLVDHWEGRHLKRMSERWQGRIEKKYGSARLNCAGKEPDITFNICCMSQV